MMKKVVSLFFYILGIYSLSAQIYVDSIGTKLSLQNHKNVEAIRVNKTTSFEEISQKTTWRPYDSTFTATKEKPVWIRFNLENNSDKAIETYVYLPSPHIDIYTKINGRIRHDVNGMFVPLSKRANKEEYFFTKINLQPLELATCYIKLSPKFVDTIKEPPYLFSKTLYLETVYNITRRHAKPIGFIYFYLISLLCIFLFVLVFWIRLRSRLYLYYLGYLFFQILYGLLTLHRTTAGIGNVFSNIPMLSYYIFDPVQFTFIGFYILFIRQLLDVKKYNTLLSKSLYYLAIFCFVYVALRVIFNYFFKDAHTGELLFSVVRFIILPLTVVFIFWIIIKVRHPLLKYFIIGQTFFFIGAVLSFYLAFTEIHFIPGNYFNFPYSLNIIFQAGLLLEVFCFSIAIGENIFLMQREKDKANEKLISQLQAHRVLQEDMHRELDKTIHQKTEELVQLYSKIEKQKEEQLKKAFTERIREMEMLALRSQMNPHFIFNSLNALKYLVMTSRNDDAVTYLDNFSILLRSILQNSTRDVITVEEELEILELYLSLEKSRIGDSFEYHIQLASKEALSQYTIPPLLLQPFVENAIWHGLSLSTKLEKRLLIKFDTKDTLRITIEDNGVGRKASGEIKKMHKSMGTNITQERMSLYNHINDSKMHLKIEDLEKNGVAQGTRIIITYNF
ncbi:histidine kinase [Tamlana sp. s12]|uniref:histidine kinase n=1 Tax=Tamlana sp. s12 TaxID=1630406 RepID=UPI0007FD77FD|nr:histidine kinase [Tamlana sp. s12]OBQ57225.1 histidine kinase [Tamlana sp. s12]QQY82587.1 histidine kinase [Tamlana sp. s12]